MEKKLIEYLKSFVTPRRNHLFDKILDMRTRYITLVLEDIYQANNASAVLRTCECFGIQDVHIIENRNEYLLNTEVTLGAEKWLDLHKYAQAENNTLTAIKELRAKGYRIVATSPQQNNSLLPEVDIEKGKSAIFLGTEISGLSNTVMENADEYIKIPMFGFTESYNISVSAALILQDLISRLHHSDIDWKLSNEEKDSINLDWLRKTIKKVELIEKKYLDNKF